MVQFRDVVGRGNDGVLRHFPLPAMASEDTCVYGGGVEPGIRAQKRSALAECSDPEQLGAGSPARGVWRAMPSQDRESLSGMDEATHGVLCDTSAGAQGDSPWAGGLDPDEVDELR